MLRKLPSKIFAHSSNIRFFCTKLPIKKITDPSTIQCIETKLEQNKEEMRKKIEAVSTNSDYTVFSATQLEETVKEEQRLCSPHGFGQS